MQKAFFGAWLLLLAPPLASCGQAPGWAAVKTAIRTSYPGVRQVTTDSLARWLQRPSAAPLLLDVRAEAEYRVSHLRAARRIDPDATVFDGLRDLPRDTPIVTYCSVGYRSAALAARLVEAGYTNVVNLEGSIFQWANEGRPVYRGERAVRQVHPYDKTWGRLLDEDLHAYTAPSH